MIGTCDGAVRINPDVQKCGRAARIEQDGKSMFVRPDGTDLLGHAEASGLLGWEADGAVRINRDVQKLRHVADAEDLHGAGAVGADDEGLLDIGRFGRARNEDAELFVA